MPGNSVVKAKRVMRFWAFGNIFVIVFSESRYIGFFFGLELEAPFCFHAFLLFCQTYLKDLILEGYYPRKSS